MKSTLRILGLLVGGFAVLLVVALWSGLSLADLRNLGTPRNVLRDAGQEVRIPVPDGPAERLLPAVVAADAGGEFAFMFPAGDGPVRYDPCRPVSWVLSPDGMPAAAEVLVHDAFTDVSARTGLVFRYEGTTDEVASFDRPLFQDRYGERFAPIIVGWSTASETAELEGSVTGLGGSSAVSGAFGDDRYLASGVVIMDSDDVLELMTSAQGTDLARAVIKHELGHVVGLAHVDDDQQLMQASNRWLTTWGPGDLQGLAIAGDGPCQDA